MNLIRQKTIKELSCNARISDSQLARKIKEPRHLVSYYRKQLHRQKVIRGAEVLINYQACALEEYIIYIKIREYQKYEHAILSYFHHTTAIIWVAEIFPYTLRLRIAVQEYGSVEKIINELNAICQHNLLEAEILFVREIIKQEIFAEMPTTLKSEPHLLLPKDWKLLHALSAHPLATLTTLAQQNDLSVEGLRQKIKEFQHKGIIISFITKYDKAAIGVNFWAQILIKMAKAQQNTPRLTAFVHHNDWFGRTRRVFGKWDFETTILIDKQETLQNVISELEKIFQQDLKETALILTLQRIVHHRIPLDFIEKSEAGMKQGQ